MIQWKGKQKFRKGEKDLKDGWGYEVSSAFSIKNT